MREYIQVKAAGSTRTDIDISTCADNEILLVVTDCTGLAFYIGTDDYSGLAAVTVDWGDGVVETNNVDGMGLLAHDYISGGLISLQGIKKWKVRIYDAIGNINVFKTAANIANQRLSQISPILEANIGATFIDNFSWTFNNEVSSPLLQRCIIKSFENCQFVTGMFRYCTALCSVTLPPSWGTVQQAQEMFSGCTALTSITLPETKSDEMLFSNLFFLDCISLKNINNFESLGNLTKQVEMSYVLSNVYGPKTIVIDSLLSALGIYGTATNPLYTESIRLSNPNSLFVSANPVINISYTSLGAAALNLLFGDLPILTGKTIKITGCQGAATCTRSIAEAKGWTVTG